MIVDLLNWWPVVVSVVLSIGGYFDLRARVDALDPQQLERYNTLLRDIKRLDEKVEKLTDFLLSEHGKSLNQVRR